METQRLDLCNVGELDFVSVQVSQYFNLCEVGLVDVISQVSSRERPSLYQNGQNKKISDIDILVHDFMQLLNLKYKR